MLVYQYLLVCLVFRSVKLYVLTCKQRNVNKVCKLKPKLIYLLEPAKKSRLAYNSAEFLYVPFSSARYS